MIPLKKFIPVKYKYVINVQFKTFWDKKSGNTYHQVIVLDNEGNELYDSGRTYGYGDQYRHTAYAWLYKNIPLPKEYRNEERFPAMAFRELEDKKYLRVNFINTNS